MYEQYSYIPKKNRNVILLSSQRQGVAMEGEEHDFKPEIILDYNKTKSAVDNLDKLAREYRCLRTSRRWPLALFFDFIDIAGHNAFCAWSDHDHPNYKVGKFHRCRFFLMQLAEDMAKPLIYGRARNPVGIQEPILAAIRMSIPVERRLRKIKPLEDVLYVLVVKTVKAIRSMTFVTTLFAGNIQKRKQL